MIEAKKSIPVFHRVRKKGRARKVCLLVGMAKPAACIYVRVYDTVRPVASAAPAKRRPSPSGYLRQEVWRHPNRRQVNA